MILKILVHPRPETTLKNFSEATSEFEQVIELLRHVEDDRGDSYSDGREGKTERRERERERSSVISRTSIDKKNRSRYFSRSVYKRG